ncbi:alpha/beta fold hydrolase [Clostridium fallax]|uniref:Pimeloyl-ACP methyl ester carboxylesterase n=1 Tax=Clostridium fallax TaxID=1533 RepID=A0A1M4TCF7_9CLOT|nr:alpha/beta hydrolase [Clostridium fallax]SHE42038.1 Pimeloyl-ACP methyl ester carboxylesterase [Clostridium fallax]SQB22695.1 carboxylic ester hydrolase [Clostridium fallax]
MKTLIKNLFTFLSITIILFAIISFIGNLFIIDTYSLNSTNSKQIKLNNININYKEFGENGSPILLIHDFFQSSKDFDNIANELSINHKVVSIDLIGFGLSDKDSDIDYSKKNMAFICNSLMNYLGYTNYSVLGHSEGGEVALNLCLDFQNNINKLILVNSSGYESISKSNIPGFIMKPLYLNYPVQLLKYSFQFFHKKTLDYDIFEENLYNNLNLSTKSIEKIFKMNDTNLIKDNIKNIQIPTLIIWGIKDSTIPLDFAYNFKNDIVNSKLIFIENCGHFPFIESPTLFVNEVNKFL